VTASLISLAGAVILGEDAGEFLARRDLDAGTPEHDPSRRHR
jgi:hypothetical protein